MRSAILAAAIFGFLFIASDRFDRCGAEQPKPKLEKTEPSRFRIVPVVMLKPGETKELVLSTKCTVGLTRSGGLSVREIMTAMARVTGIAFTPEIAPRRPGDPDRIVATGELAARDLDWKNRYTVDEMVRTGWEARRAAG